MIAATVFTMMLAMAETPSELNNRAVVLYREAHYADAEQSYRAALEAWRQTPGSERDRAVTLNNLAVLYRTTARYREAREAQEESLRQLRIVEGDRGRGVAMALANLADLHRLVGNPQEAESTARLALEIHRANREQGPEAATAMQVLASTEIEKRRYATARELLNQALAIRERTLGASDALTGSIWSSFATLEMAAGDYPAAEAAARKALAIARSSRGERNPAAASCLNNLAQALRFQGRYLEAEPLYRQAVAVWEAALGSDHPDAAKGMANLAAFYHDRGREAGAEALYARARGIFSRSLGPRHPSTLLAAGGLADVYRAQRRFSEALKLSRAVLPVMERTFSADDPQLKAAQASYARLTAEADPPQRKSRPAVALGIRTP